MILSQQLKELSLQGHREIFIVPPGIGDGIMANAVARAYHRQFGCPMLVGHCFPELFEHDPDVICLREFAYYAVTAERKKIAEECGFSVKCLHYCEFSQTAENLWLYYYPGRPLIEMMAEEAGISGEFEMLPRLYLTEAEKAAGKLFPERQIAILSTGRDLYKSYPAECFQAIVDAFPEYHFVQLGDKNDPPLRNAQNLQGKLTVRQSAAVLANSSLFIGLVGALMHIARAVDCRSVIVCPACEPGDSMHYPEFVNIMPPSGCNRCLAEHRPPSCCGEQERCTRDIEVDEVIEKIRSELNKAEEPLSFRTVSVTPHPVTGMEMQEMRESAPMMPVRAYYGGNASHYLRGHFSARWFVLGNLEYEAVFGQTEVNFLPYTVFEFEKRPFFAIQILRIEFYGKEHQLLHLITAVNFKSECCVSGARNMGNGRLQFRLFSDGIRITLPKIVGSCELRLIFRAISVPEGNCLSTNSVWNMKYGFLLARKLKKLLYR